MANRWLSRSEVSARYGPSAKTLANWAALDKGPPFVRVGGRARYREDDIETWLARQPRGGESIAHNGGGNGNRPPTDAASRA